MSDYIGVFVLLGVENESDGNTAGIGVSVEVGDGGDARGV